MLLARSRRSKYSQPKNLVFSGMSLPFLFINNRAISYMSQISQSLVDNLALLSQFTG